MDNSRCSTGRASPSEHTHGQETPAEGRQGKVCKSPKIIDYRPALLSIAEAIFFNALINKEGFIRMANNFEGLSGAIDAVVAGIEEVAAAIANPAVDNNDQTVIDSLTTRLLGAADALKAATAAEVVEDGTTVTPPADGTGSGDVTP